MRRRLPPKGARSESAAVSATGSIAGSIAAAGTVATAAIAVANAVSVASGANEESAESVANARTAASVATAPIAITAVVASVAARASAVPKVNVVPKASAAPRVNAVRTEIVALKANAVLPAVNRSRNPRPFRSMQRPMHAWKVRPSPLARACPERVTNNVVVGVAADAAGAVEATRRAGRSKVRLVPRHPPLLPMPPRPWSASR